MIRTNVLNWNFQFLLLYPTFFTTSSNLATYNNTLTLPPVCCQISQHICCLPEPLVIQPPPVCCMQTSQVLVPQQPIPAPLSAPLPAIGQGATIQLSSHIFSPAQIGRSECCNCCPCFGNGHKRRSLFFLRHKLDESK
ncbi:hypothetical protein QQG55_49490 [Brugia pahangi]|uniref:Uncharacterized protein n=1 Tax=Brugia pahangi TaxID=6280 RepID=A0A0N4T273_BRUPA|nr:unnamed protein product [Brugia pahangi]